MMDKPLFTIQYLRAVAAIAVVVGHIAEIYRLDWRLGGAGVDLFFVISGFIMWLVTRQSEATPTKFVKKRLLRIVPLYWLVTLFLALSASFLPNLFPLDHPVLQHVLLSLLFVPHLSPDGRLFPLVSQGWTLNYEMFFYFLFALTLAAPRRSQFYFVNLLLLGGVVLGYLVTPSSPAGVAYTSPLLIEFLAGIYICRAWLANRVFGQKCAWIAVALGLASIAAKDFLDIQLPRVINSGLPATLIVFGAVSLERGNHVVEIRWLKYLGDSSYSIYLTHYLAWLFISIVIAKLGNNIYSLQFFPVVVCAGIAAGVATYSLVERPMVRFFSRILFKRGLRAPNDGGDGHVASSVGSGGAVTDANAAAANGNAAMDAVEASSHAPHNIAPDRHPFTRKWLS